ncbi:MAG: glycosyltransferase family 4 protein [Planctomycetes bacterium]|nr:glycosyltransferase family 4 protein [Planctomycetota bacterium]
MRLTIINQFYKPDISPTARLAASLAEHRAATGDEVTVVTSHGGYVSVASGACEQETKGPRVLRVWTPQFGKSNLIKRCLDYGTFYLLAAWRLLTLSRQDVIIALTTPPFIAWVAVFHKLLHPKTRVVLWNMDCYPEVAERAGVIKPGGVVSRILQSLNRALFRRLDDCVCLDEAMLSLLQSRYASNGSLSATVIPNWARLTSSRHNASTESSVLRRDDRFQNRLVVLYFGNMGCGHRFETVVDAAEVLRDEPVVFRFVGGGSQMRVIEEAERQRGLSNVVTEGYVDEEDCPEADCALITLRDEMLGVMSPSKMHASLAMRLPILYVGPKGSNVDLAIDQFGCGASLRHGDVGALVQTIRQWLAEPSRLVELGVRARGAFEEAYCDKRVLPQFDILIDRLAGTEVLPAPTDVPPPHSKLFGGMRSNRIVER